MLNTYRFIQKYKLRNRGGGSSSVLVKFKSLRLKYRFTRPPPQLLFCSKYIDEMCLIFVSFIEL